MPIQWTIYAGHGQPADDDMMTPGARIRAYATTGEIGPLAIAASTPESHERAHPFVALADAERPLKIFRELHTARKWLDAQAPSGKVLPPTRDGETKLATPLAIFRLLEGTGPWSELQIHAEPPNHSAHRVAIL